MTILRQGLLAGRTIALAGPTRPDVGETLVTNGGSVAVLPSAGAAEVERAQEWARARAPLHGLVYDAAAPFGQGGRAGLLGTLAEAWVAVAAIANGALIPGQTGGKAVLLAPRADAGPHSGAARDGLENLARTLSVEWARYGITTTAIAPGAASTDQEVAQLVAFLVSPAGDYFSGCRFEMGAC